MNIDELIKKTAGIPVDLTEQGEASIAGRLQKNYSELTNIFNSAKRLKSFQPQFAQKIEEFHELFEKSITRDGQLTPKGKGAEYLEKGNEFLNNNDFKGFMQFISNIILAGAGKAVVTELEGLNKTSEQIVEAVVKEKTQS